MRYPAPKEELWPDQRRQAIQTYHEDVRSQIPGGR
jgi:hypothetical protein